VVTVTLPPLRRRKGDIPALVSHFIDKYGKSYGKPVHALGPGALNAILAHDWPGNVRELENAIERAVVLAHGGELTIDDLPPSLRGAHAAAPAPSSVTPGATLREMERDAILRTLALVDGSTARAAKMLGISVRKVQYRLKEYRLTGQLSSGPSDNAVVERVPAPAAA
jgi:two-component system, NtrC family, response regulator